MIKNRKSYFAGIVLVLAVVMTILTVFSKLCTTNNICLYLMDTASTRYGWSYTVMAGGKAADVEPEFLDEYTMVFPEEDSVEAVKITRTLTETLPDANIEWNSYNSAVEVFVAGKLVYSDFQISERNEEGFLLLQREDIEQIEQEKTVKISLPKDYTGAELTMITYFGEGAERNSPDYPFLGNYQADYASYVVSSVQPVAIMTLCGIFAIMITVIFVLDITNKEKNFRILLLGLYYVLLFIGMAYSSLPGVFSTLSEWGDLSFLMELYAAPLYLYLALDLKGWKKYLMSASVILWFLYEGIRILWNIKEAQLPRMDRNGLGALILFAAVALNLLLEYLCGKKKEKWRRYYIYYGLLAVIVSIFCVFDGAREWNRDVGMYLFQIGYTGARGNYFPAVHLITNICGIMVTILLFFEFIRRAIETKETIAILEERSRLTLEGYNRVLKAEEVTNSVRHEMLHHMTALMGILKNGEEERACEYIASVTDEIIHLPTVRYSQNILVNVIAGTYLDKAKEAGIQVEHSFQIPADLEISDEDLSVFLTNMLQNALQACERMNREEERYIRVKMYLSNNFLFIGCVNSRPRGEERETGEQRGKHGRTHGRHGFGMEAMSRIAEKYGSILKIEEAPQEFAVKSNLCLKLRQS